MSAHSADPLLIDGKYWTAKELSEIDGPLHVKGDLDLRSYAHALPKLTSIGGNADLSGYAHALPALTSIGGNAYLHSYAHALPSWLLDGGADGRRYYFTAMFVDGAWRIRAGCRDFSIEAARSHWGPGGASDRPDCLALVELIVARIAAASGGVT